ncbi:uncharacterized protein LOC141617828 [Silene latifolia]|uniref:uncharacterized protein LOC141617828 n=1 Tax=Silene latifolia TaxID=37657 RepID=UPI003D77B689
MVEYGVSGTPQLLNWKNQQLVGSIKDQYGQTHQGIDSVANAFVNYYTGLLGIVTSVEQLDASLLSKGATLTAEDWVTLLAQTGNMPKQANSTIISLIPKKEVPATVQDYRSISCCSTFYKSVSKIQAIRMQILMPKLIGNEQAAFIKRRSIHENIMLTQSLIKGYRRKYKTPRCFMKIDITSAFDSLQWEYLKINGTIKGFFQGRSGIRQGDPLSPYIFVLSMEILSRQLRVISNKPQVFYHPKCSKVQLTHLIFVDDLMIFTRGDVPSIQVVTKALNKFGAWSGLIANKEKTNIYFGGTQDNIKAAILEKTVGVAKLINRYCKDLFWAIHEGARKWVFKSWKSICAPWEEGGFGLKELMSWNRALLLKWIWLLGRPNSSLLASWVQHYCLYSNSIWSVVVKDKFSESFRGILATRDYCINLAGGVTEAKDAINSCVTNRLYSMEKAYNLLRIHYPHHDWTRALRSSSILPKHRVIASVALDRKLATLDNLTVRGMIMVNRCVLRKNARESHEHLFLSCPFSQSIWLSLKRWMILGNKVEDLHTEMDRNLHRRYIAPWMRHQFQCCFAATIYSMWMKELMNILKQGN